jgi:hypothetical protein
MTKLARHVSYIVAGRNPDGCVPVATLLDFNEQVQAHIREEGKD